MPLFQPNEAEILKKFGAKMREARKKKGLSQEQLSQEIEMDLTSVNEIEQGHRSPKLITIYKITKALKVSAGELLPF